MKTFLLSLVAGLVITSICACGGGTIGTGLGMRGGGYTGFNGGSQADVAFTLHVMIKNAKGVPQSNASLRINSSLNSFSCITAPHGACVLDVRIVAGEPVTVVIRKDGVEYSSEQYLSPAGETHVSRTFVLGANRTIEIRER